MSSPNHQWWFVLTASLATILVISAVATWVTDQIGPLIVFIETMGLLAMVSFFKE